MLFGILLSLGGVLGFAYLALRGIRALEVGSVRPDDLAVLAEEIEQLREQHQRLGSQVAALRDGQEFTRQLGRRGDATTAQPESRSE
jgi:cell division protein FtsB